MNLKCSGEKNCDNEIKYIDIRGFIYCKNHGLTRKYSTPCRNLAKFEIKILQYGKPTHWKSKEYFKNEF